MKLNIFWLFLLTLTSFEGYSAPQKEPDKILFIMPRLTVGGTARAFVSMINLLPIPDDKIDIYIKQRGYPFEKLIRRKANFPSWDQACKTKYKAVVSYAHFVIQPQLWVNTIQAKKKIQWIHTDLLKSVEQTPFKQRKNLKGIDYFVCVSEASKQSFITMYPHMAAKTLAIHNLVDEVVIQKQAEEPVKEIAKDKGLKVVTVARLGIEKGIDRAVQVHRLLEDAGIHFHWYVAGEGPQKKVLEQLIHKYHLEGKFILLGLRENPYPYIKNADLFVLPSRIEGRSVVISEAQVLHRPILATQAGGIREQLRSGENGLIVANDTTAIFEGMKFLLTNALERQKYIEAQKDYHYDNSVALQQLQKLFE